MRLLALDTTSGACSVALAVGGAVVARRFEPMTRGHAEALLPMIETVIAEAGERYDALDLVAVTVGPGTFTGLRVGLATARGLALALGLPLLGVTTLEALAEATETAERAGRSVLALMNARRGQVYGQAFDGDLKALGEPWVHAPEAVIGTVIESGPAGPLLLVGDGAPLVEPALAAGGVDAILSSAPALPDAAQVAALAHRRVKSARPGPEVAPLYLRGPGASPPGASAPGDAGSR